MRPRILVLLSAYNGEALLEEQLRSILAQKCGAEITVRVRDDGSADGTAALVQKLQEIHPGRIELIRGENLGYNGSFFTLLSGAYGYDYYALCDQDDVWMEDKLQSALDFLEKEDPGTPLLYACPSVMTDADLHPIGETRRKEREITIRNTQVQNICPGHNQVLNQTLLELVRGPWETSEMYVYDLWIANTAALYGKILFDDSPHTFYRQHGTNELGSSGSRIGKLLKAGKRAFAGEGEKNRRQMAYFARCHELALKKAGVYEDILRFLSARRFGQRTKLVLRFPFYRQSRVETAALKLAVWLGKY